MRLLFSSEFHSYKDYFKQSACDLHFVIAPKNDEEHEELIQVAHLFRKSRKTVILDNRAFETTKDGEGVVPWERLVGLGHLIGADYIIPPDKHDDMAYTCYYAHEALAEPGWPSTKIALVVAGRTVSEQVKFVRSFAHKVSKLCFSFLSPIRARTLQALVSEGIKLPSVHLLGVKGIDELRACLRSLEALGLDEVSVDTSKIVRSLVHEHFSQSMLKRTFTLKPIPRYSRKWNKEFKKRVEEFKRWALSETTTR